MPGMSGVRGWDRNAVAVIRTRVVLVAQVRGVALDLDARRKEPRPARVGLEPVRVRGGRDVHSDTRVMVDVPSAAEVILAVENDEVVEPEALELDRSADAAETRTDDDGVKTVRVHSLTPAYASE